jgi:hypothetical protein
VYPKSRTLNDGYAYDLDIKTYDKLKDPERSAPAYLVLVVVPAKLEAWIKHYTEEMLLSCHAYWAAFDAKISRPNKTSTAIRLPRDQRLTVSSLEVMFEVSRNRVLYGILGGEAA